MQDGDRTAPIKDSLHNEEIASTNVLGSFAGQGNKLT